MTTVLCILGYVAIGVMVALFFSWRGITKDVTSMLVVTYLWPVFAGWWIIEMIFINGLGKLYKKFNRKVKKWKENKNG